jgi:hypothetical protein
VRESTFGQQLCGRSQGEFFVRSTTNEEVNQIIDIDLKRSEDVRGFGLPARPQD